MSADVEWIFGISEGGMPDTKPLKETLVANEKHS